MSEFAQGVVVGSIATSVSLVALAMVYFAGFDAGRKAKP